MEDGRAFPGLRARPSLVVAAWFGYGATLSVALPYWLSRPESLVLGAVVPGVVLLWVLGRNRYCAAFLVGSSLGPVNLAAHLDSCSAAELQACPADRGLWLVAAAASLTLLVVGLWVLRNAAR